MPAVPPTTSIPKSVATDPLRRSVEVIFLKDVVPEEPRHWAHWPLVILLTLTAIGGIIRFMFLNHPCLWGDEAAVYWRICGTYAEMLVLLRGDGFGPLHYEMNWLLGHFIKPTPPVIRFIPALCGTLMIPAMYFLARQMLQRSTALLAAAITTFSGFLIFYSRDAKMYSDTWLFIVLNVGALLWWFRTHRPIAWLCWIAAGCAASGIHASALIVVGLAPIMFLTQGNVRYRHTLLLVLGLILIVSGPVGYYFKFNHWVDDVDERGWRASGIEWVDGVNRDLTGPELVRYAATSYLMGWEWPRAGEEPRIMPWLVKWPKIGAEILGGILLLSLLPWPLMLRPRQDDDLPPEPQWRVFWWLGFWMVIPGYVMYCHSMHDFAAPSDWLHNTIAAIPLQWMSPLNGRPLGGWALGACIVFGYIAGLCVPMSRPGFIRGLKTIAAAAALWAGCEIAYLICHQLSLDAMLTDRGWHSIWQPRYLGFIWPAVALSSAALIMRLPTRTIRTLVIAILLGINFSFGMGRIFGHTEPPVDQMATDVFAAQSIDSHTRTYTNIHTAGPIPSYGTLFSLPGHYYLQMNAWRQPMTPDRFRNTFLDEFTYRSNYNPATVAEEVNDTRFLDQVIVWDELNLHSTSNEDPLLPRLPGWKLSSETMYPVRAFWEWQDVLRFRRREYVRDLVGRPVSAPPIPHIR